MSPGFCEIGTRSNFSFLEGASHPAELVEAAQKLGLSGLGLADRNTVAGVVRMHVHAKLMSLRFQPGARLVFVDQTPELLVYPINRRGWGNLCRILTAGNLRSQKGVCTLYEKDLMKWSGDLMIAVVPPALMDTGEVSAFEADLVKLKTVFADRLFLLMVPRHDGLDRLMHAELAGIGQRLGLPLLASNDPFHHAPERQPLADVVTAIREHVTIAQAGFRLAANAERHLKDAEEMARLLRHYPEAVENTEKFFRRLSFSVDELAHHHYPDESIGGETPTAALRRLTYEGAARRFPTTIPDKVLGLIEYELALIEEKEYEAYFLTVHRIITHARDQNILCQGRGSAANSAVCFCLGITEVNPEHTTLLFERFISTERDEPPDIDVDFEHMRREDVIQFIYEEYGREHSALTAAVISYRARSAGREVAKAFGLSEDVQSALSGSIWGWWTSDFGTDQAKAAGLDLNDPTSQRVLHYAGLLQSFPRHLSQHVGGFVITRDRLDEIVPIMNTADGRYMIEWDKDDLDAIKILKIDVLALGMLTCLAKAFRLLKSHYGVEETMAGLLERNRQEPEVYDMMCRADTIGVFQIESRAQMSMLPRLRPREFYDLVIEVAIVRPGPIQGNMVHPYLKRREDKRAGREIQYPKEELRGVLERTLGIPLFQEQAMQIAITGAGFTPSEADRLRRAMATFRRTGQVGDFRERFIRGMLERGYDKDFAERCFSQIEGFGEYGFPESHAASFALLVYVSCWFKARYPDIFLVALLNSQPMGFYSPAQLVRDAREHGVAIRPVDINHSAWDNELEVGSFDPRRIARRHQSMAGVIRTQHAVRLGFRQLKGLKEVEMGRLVAARGEGYRSVRDLWLRSGLSKQVIEKLAEADAFSSIGLSRRNALWEVQALDTASATEALPLFAIEGGDRLENEPGVALPRMRPSEEVIEDYRTLTLSLKGHPVSFLRDGFSRQGVARAMDLDTAFNGRRVTIAGVVLIRQRPGSAKGVIFMTLEDETGVANVIVWKKTFEKYRATVMGARLVRVHGRLQKADGVIHVVAERLEDISHMLPELVRDPPTLDTLARADEVRRPMRDARRDTQAEGAVSSEGPASRRLSGEAVQVHKVMPRGRNFH